MSNTYLPELATITLSDGTKYHLEDTYARELIEEISEYSDFLGVTTSAVEETEQGGVVIHSTVNPIDIVEKLAPVTAVKGNIVIKGTKEYIFDGTYWIEFGDLSGLLNMLGKLAFVDTASASYTPQGTVSANFTGTQSRVEVSGIPSGQVSIPTVSAAAQSSENNYTPSGTISSPNISVTPTRKTVAKVTSNGQLPSISGGLLNVEIGTGNKSDTLIFTTPRAADVFDPGELPTFENTEVLSDVSAALASDPVFSGEAVKIEAEFNGTTSTFGGNYTPSGNITNPKFTGTNATITVSTTD